MTLAQLIEQTTPKVKAFGNGSPFVVVDKEGRVVFYPNLWAAITFARETAGCVLSYRGIYFQDVEYGLWNVLKEHTETRFETDKHGDITPYPEKQVYLSTLYSFDDGYTSKEPTPLVLRNSKETVDLGYAMEGADIRIDRADIPEVIKYLQHFYDTGELFMETHDESTV